MQEPSAAAIATTNFDACGGEKDFLASIGAWEGELTDRQQEKLDQIESEIPLRLELARQGRWPINR